MNDAITNANTMMQTVDDVGNIFKELAGDERDRERLRQAMRTLPDTLQDIRSTVAGAKARIGEIEQFTKKLGSTELIERMERGTKHLDAVMDDLAMFSQRLRNPNGSLALLLEDRELYDHLNRAATNVDQLSRQLKPIVNDVRIFTDKIARHPESLGVRGAIQRSPGIK